MATNVLRIAIFGKDFQAERQASIETVLDSLTRHGVEVYIERTFFQYLTEVLAINVPVQGVFDNYNFDVDVAISIGGDGTFLHAASMVGAKGTPI